MPEMFRTQIESTLKRFEPPTEALTVMRKLLNDQGWRAAGAIVVGADDAMDVVSGFDGALQMLEVMTRGALENADRASLQGRRVGQLMVDIDRQVTREATRANDAERRIEAALAALDAGDPVAAEKALRPDEAGPA